jgi:hypothetical protein
MIYYIILSKWMIDLKQGFAFKAILLVQESISLSVSDTLSYDILHYLGTVI